MDPNCTDATDRIHTTIPGNLHVGQPFLVGGLHLCLASTEISTRPSKQAVQAMAGKLHAWEDHSLVAIWNPSAGCYDGSLSWSTHPSATSLAGSAAACVSVVCGSTAICAASGLDGDCARAAALQEALNPAGSVAAWSGTMRWSVHDAAEATTSIAQLCGQIQQTSSWAALSVLESKRSVWSQQQAATLGTMRASSAALQSSEAARLATLRAEAIPQLTALLEEALPTWPDRHEFMRKKDSTLAMLHAHAHNCSWAEDAAFPAAHCASRLAFTLTYLTLPPPTEHGRTYFKLRRMVL